MQNMSTPFSIPAFKDVDETNGILPDEGWYDFTLTEYEPKLSKKMNAMIVIAMIMDNGAFAGKKHNEYIVFGLETGKGEAKFKQILKAANQEWEPKPTLEEFAKQFPPNKLRVGAKCEYEYQIEEEYKSWKTVPRSKYDEWDGKKSIKLKPTEYRPPESPATMKFGQPDMFEEQKEANLPFEPQPDPFKS